MNDDGKDRIKDFDAKYDTICIETNGDILLSLDDITFEYKESKSRTLVTVNDDLEFVLEGSFIKYKV